MNPIESQGQPTPPSPESPASHPGIVARTMRRLRALPRAYVTAGFVGVMILVTIVIVASGGLRFGGAALNQDPPCDPLYSDCDITPGIDEGGGGGGGGGAYTPYCTVGFTPSIVPYGGSTTFTLETDGDEASWRCSDSGPDWVPFTTPPTTGTWTDRTVDNLCEVRVRMLGQTNAAYYGTCDGGYHVTPIQSCSVSCPDAMQYGSDPQNCVINTVPGGVADFYNFDVSGIDAPGPKNATFENWITITPPPDPGCDPKGPFEPDQEPCVAPLSWTVSGEAEDAADNGMYTSCGSANIRFNYVAPACVNPTIGSFTGAVAADGESVTFTLSGVTGNALDGIIRRGTTVVGTIGAPGTFTFELPRDATFNGSQTFTVTVDSSCTTNPVSATKSTTVTIPAYCTETYRETTGCPAGQDRECTKYGRILSGATCNWGTGSSCGACTQIVVAPNITSPASVTGTVGQALSYAITASGTTPITYSAPGLPAGLSLSGSTISGTPTASGSTSVTITATNSAGSDSQAVSFVIQGAGTPPNITSPVSASAVAGQAFTYQATASGTTPIAFARSGTNPTWASVSSTGAVTGTPPSAGDATLTLTATNSAGSDTQAIQINIAAASPTIGPMTFNAIKCIPPGGAAGDPFLVGQSGQCDAYFWVTDNSGRLPAFAQLVLRQGSTNISNIVSCSENPWDWNVMNCAAQTAGPFTTTGTKTLQAVILDAQGNPLATQPTGGSVTLTVNANTGGIIGSLEYQKNILGRGTSGFVARIRGGKPNATGTLVTTRCIGNSATCSTVRVPGWVSTDALGNDDVPLTAPAQDQTDTDSYIEWNATEKTSTDWLIWDMTDPTITATPTFGIPNGAPTALTGTANELRWSSGFGTTEGVIPPDQYKVIGSMVDLDGTPGTAYCESGQTYNCSGNISSTANVLSGTDNHGGRGTNTWAYTNLPAQDKHICGHRYRWEFWTQSRVMDYAETAFEFTYNPASCTQGVPSQANSSITVTAGACTTATSTNRAGTVRVVVKDGQGTPVNVTGAVVTLEAFNGATKITGAQITPASITTTSNGEANFDVVIPVPTAVNVTFKATVVKGVTTFVLSSTPATAFGACPVCVATTCQAQGATCGTISNGCGGTLSCGTCTAPQTCTNNTCSCTPTTCSVTTPQCGTVTGTDNCGGTCTRTGGTCPTGQQCSAQNTCVCTPVNGTWQPGTWGVCTAACTQTRTYSCVGASCGGSCPGTQPAAETQQCSGGACTTDDPPVCGTSIATPNAGPAPLAVQFTHTGATDPENNPMTYAWTYRNTNPVSQVGTGAGQTANFTFQNPGNYTAEVRINDGTQSTVCPTIPITVQPATCTLAPILQLTPNTAQNVAPNGTVSFTVNAANVTWTLATTTGTVRIGTGTAGTSVTRTATTQATTVVTYTAPASGSSSITLTGTATGPNCEDPTALTPVTVTVASYTCTGTDPANATACPNDTTGLTANVAKHVVGTCSATNTNNADRCEWICATGFTLQGGACVPVGPVCGNGTVETGEQCDDSNTTANDGCSATCQLETPRNVACTSVTQTSFRGTWTAPQNGAANFRLSLRTGSTVVQDTTVPASTSFRDYTNLTSSTTYTFGVRAVSAASVEGPEATVQCTTGAPSIPSITLTPDPASVIADGKTESTLTCALRSYPNNPATGTLAGYAITFTKIDGNGTLLTTSGTTTVGQDPITGAPIGIATANVRAPLLSGGEGDTGNFECTEVSTEDTLRGTTPVIFNPLAPEDFTVALTIPLEGRQATEGGPHGTHKTKSLEVTISAPANFTTVTQSDLETDDTGFVSITIPGLVLKEGRQLHVSMKTDQHIRRTVIGTVVNNALVINLGNPETFTEPAIVSRKGKLFLPAGDLTGATADEKLNDNKADTADIATWIADFRKQSSCTTPGEYSTLRADLDGNCHAGAEDLSLIIRNFMTTGDNRTAPVITTKPVDDPLPPTGCGNGTCDAALNETATSCPADCANTDTNALGSCTGSALNGTPCAKLNDAADETGLTQSTPYTAVNVCTQATKCEFRCDAGFTPDQRGNNCVAL